MLSKCDFYVIFILGDGMFMKLSKNKKGFTLIELLATIAILAIVVSITLYVSLGAIEKSKEKSYKVTINNIQKEAANYLLENSDRLFFISDTKDLSVEYQCITVQNLIDMGYFNEDITESKIDKNTKVNTNMYVYIKRDRTTKAINETILISDSNNETCSKAVKAKGDVAFVIEPLGWSREKKITLYYSLNNLNDVTTIGNYKYDYEYSGVSEKIYDNNTEKQIKVISNGNLEGYITLNNEEIVRKSFNVDKIDNVGPVIELGNVSQGYVSKTVAIPLKVSDAGSGVDYDSFEKSDVKVEVGGNVISDISLSGGGKGNFNLIINNDKYSGEVVITIAKNSVYDKVVDEVKNGNNETVLKPDVKFDNTPPTKPDINNPTNENWTNSNFSLSVSTMEDGSGVDYWQYTYAENPSGSGDHNTSWVTYSNSSNNSFTTSPFSAERNQLVYIRVCDKVGNCSDVSNTYIRIDKTAPTVPTTMSFVFGDWTGYTDASWTNKGVYTARSAGKSDASLRGPSGSTDTGSGIAKYQISSDGSTWVDYNYVSTDAMYYMSSEGTHYRYFRACDNAGNCGSSLTKTAKIDKTPPSCSISGNPTSYVQSATLTLSGTDNNNLASSPYSWTSSTSGFSTTKTKSITQNGTYTGYVKDVAGNVASCSVSVDKVAKEITITYDKNYLSSSIWTDTLTTGNWDKYNVSISKTTDSLSTAMEGKLVKITINSVSGYGGPFFNSKLDLSIGSTYTEEFFIKASRNMSLSVGAEQGGVSSLNVTTEWQRFRHEFTAAGNTGQGNRAFVFYSSLYKVGDVIYIHSLQVMKGTEGNATAIKIAGSSFGDLPAPSRSNYEFKGWYTSPSGGTQIISSTSVPTSNTTYYAQWEYTGTSISTGGGNGGTTGGPVGLCGSCSVNKDCSLGTCSGKCSGTNASGGGTYECCVYNNTQCN